MKTLLTNCFLAGLSALIFTPSLFGQDWENVPVPAQAGAGKEWELQTVPSDDFNYNFNATTQRSNFGNNKWYNFYHNSWDGPGTTYWQHDHISVDGDNLVLKASRNPSTSKLGVAGINSGCITSNTKVLYPVFVEASVSVANIALASDVWLLSPDDTQEIDIIECYGGADSGNAFFAQFIHLSHHSFIRNPFTDYQPRDHNSWWSREGVSAWGDYCWNDGNRQYVQVGVNWISPKHFEYYVDGELVRVLYDKAFASKINGVWYYNYPTNTNGALDFTNGYQTVIAFATSTDYSFETLENASNTSNTSVIDPYNFQGGDGFTKELDIIINVESQDWHVQAGRTPSDADLLNPAKNTMLVDWIRVYKPIDAEAAQLTKLGAGEGFAFLEGPVWNGNNELFFTDITGNKVVKYNPAQNDFATVIASAQRANGLMFNADNELLVCEGSTGKITRRNSNGTLLETMVDTYNGVRFNGPNDLCVDKKGGIYFTDPTFEGTHQSSPRVYYRQTDGTVIAIINDLAQPNGVLLSHDGTKLYVSNTASTKVRVYDVNADGTVANGADFATLAVGSGTATDTGADGMATDMAGNVYVTSYAGVQIFNSNGVAIQTIEVPEKSTNCTFGGSDMKTLYITAGQHLYAIQNTIAGVRHPFDLPEINEPIAPTSVSIVEGTETTVVEQSSLELTASVLPANASNKSVIWSSSNTALATVSSTGTVQTFQAGNVVITATTVVGNFTADYSIAILPNETEEGVIEAESFTNTGGPYNGWEVYSVGTVTGINYNQTGDWAEYELNLAAGEYSISYDLATTVSGAAIKVWVDGVAIGTDNVPNNGNWDEFQTLVSNHTLTLTGTHTLRLEGAGTNGWEWNMDKFMLERLPDPTPIPVTGVSLDQGTLSIEQGQSATLVATVAPADADDLSVVWSSSDETIATVENGVVTANFTAGIAIISVTTNDGSFIAESVVTVEEEDSTPITATIIIEAENFSSTGGTINDAAWGGPGLGANATASAINWVNSNDYTLQNIEVTVAGNYDITYLISTPSDNAQIQVLVDDQIVATDDIPNNGSWDSYGNVQSSSSVALTAGSHTVKLVASGSNAWQWNLDRVTLTTGNMTNNRLATNTTQSFDQAIKVVPNPAANKIDFTQVETAKIEIFNLTGERVLSTHYLSGRSIDVSQFKKGMYMVRISTENKQDQFIKLLVQ